MVHSIWFSVYFKHIFISYFTLIFVSFPKLSIHIIMNILKNFKTCHNLCSAIFASLHLIPCFNEDSYLHIFTTTFWPTRNFWFLVRIILSHCLQQQQKLIFAILPPQMLVSTMQTGLEESVQSAFSTHSERKKYHNTLIVSDDFSSQISIQMFRVLLVHIQMFWNYFEIELY